MDKCRALRALCALLAVSALVGAGAAAGAHSAGRAKHSAPKQPRLAGAKRAGPPAAPAPAPGAVRYETRWFEQLVDHFAWANQDTWQQRYLVNQDHWGGPNFPILLYTGNEGDIEVFANNTGWMWESAAKLHAMLVFAEHRFYGRSMPYKIDPTRVRPDETRTLGYLSSEQALADYARLVFELKRTLLDASQSPVIAVGGSYGGMLAAWMRMKYPNLVAGALAASAPILQFPGQYDCRQFNRIVTQDFADYSANCSRSIALSWPALRQLGASQAGLGTLARLFNTCAPLGPADVAPLGELLNSIWVNMAMTDYANAASFLSDMPAYPIRHACAQLAADPTDLEPAPLLAAVARAAQVYTNSSGRAPCLDVNKWLYDPMDVLWDFQACTEMVMPICADGVNDMFEPQPFDVAAFARACRARWGVRTQPHKVQALYGDRHLHAASNIIFSSCSRDPWSAGCPQQSVDERQLVALHIAGACHHEDLRPAGPNDTAAVREARAKELELVGKWIEQHYEAAKKADPAQTVRWKARTERAQ